MSFINSVTELTIWTTAVFYLGKGVLSAIRYCRDIKIQEIEIQNKRTDELVHLVEQQQQDGIIYWYDLDNGQFLAQGCDYNEITAVLASRFPRHIFVINQNEMLVGPDFNQVHNFEQQKT